MPSLLRISCLGDFVYHPSLFYEAPHVLQLSCQTVFSLFLVNFEFFLLSYLQLSTYRLLLYSFAQFYRSYPLPVSRPQDSTKGRILLLYQQIPDSARRPLLLSLSKNTVCTFFKLINHFLAIIYISIYIIDIEMFLCYFFIDDFKHPRKSTEDNNFMIR